MASYVYHVKPWYKPTVELYVQMPPAVTAESRHPVAYIASAPAPRQSAGRAPCRSPPKRATCPR